MNFTDPFKTNIFKLNATSVCLFEVNLTIWHVTMMNQWDLIHMVI